MQNIEEGGREGYNKSSCKFSTGNEDALGEGLLRNSLCIQFSSKKHNSELWRFNSTRKEFESNIKGKEAFIHKTIEICFYTALLPTVDEIQLIQIIFFFSKMKFLSNVRVAKFQRAKIRRLLKINQETFLMYLLF